MNAAAPRLLIAPFCGLAAKLEVCAFEIMKIPRKIKLWSLPAHYLSSSASYSLLRKLNLAQGKNMTPQEHIAANAGCTYYFGPLPSP